MLDLSIIVLTRSLYESDQFLDNFGFSKYNFLFGQYDKNNLKESKINGKIVFPQFVNNLGARKQELIEKARGDWVLILDSDEMLSEELKEEIKKILSDPKTSKGINGYRIPYQNYVFGHPVHYGGERYSKVRLFRRGKGRVSEMPLHEEVEVDGKIVDLKGVIHHHSYRNPIQLYTKFTKYAWTASRMKKKSGESLTVKKLLLYGPHMFWARFVKDKGYKDGIYGLILAKAFGFMEGMTYWFMLI